MLKPSETAILLITCPDKKGIVAAISDFLFRNQGNIVHADQYTDPETQVFFMRIEWELNEFKIPRDKFVSVFNPLAKKYKMQWDLHHSNFIPKMAIFVSKQGHCLLDILSRYRDNEFRAEIPLIISNHPDLESIAESFHIKYVHIPVTQENKPRQEKKELELLKKHNINLIVLARYMQILSKDFIQNYPNQIINIHHSFLPAFAGGKPYHQAYEKGVKIIGATSHYATADLDEGPIIEQDVIRVSHRDRVEDLIRKGRDLEKIVLARAIRLHLQNRILVYRNKTIVFD